MKKILTRLRGVSLDAKIFIVRTAHLRPYFKSLQIIIVSTTLMFSSFAFTSSIEAMVAPAPTSGNVADQQLIAQDVQGLEEKKLLGELKRAVRQPQASPQIQAIIDKWLARNPNMSGGVAFHELTGAMRFAGTNADKQFFAASIYKLYVADFVYSKIETGAIQPDAYVLNGRTYAQCLEAMMVVSDNDCPHSIAAIWGWNTIHAFAQGSGFRKTSLLNGVNRASATDAADLLMRLQAGTLVSSSHRERLLGHMKRQIYRAGVPAGSTGSVVANKTGHYDAVVHDASIVYGKKTTYVLVVMTEGGSYSKIADLAAEISNFVNG